MNIDVETTERELDAYLAHEARRIAVHDRLDEIERGMNVISIVDTPRRRRRLPAAAAALVAVAGAGLLMLDGRGSQGLTSGAETAATVATTSTTTTPPPLDVPLPAGATLQGFTPSCTTTDGIEYLCTVEDYPAATFDRTGEAQAIVDDTSHVSGGCRSTSPDGSRWTCYVGMRAVEEQIVAERFLGEWVQPGWADG